MPSGPWSAPDLARAVAMRTDGATPDAIAAALGRSAAAVSLRLHRARAEGHAVPVDRTLTPWTRERADRACAMWGAGAHVDDIARELGTTPKAARAYVERARKERPYMERPRRWSPERIGRFAAAWNRGTPVDDMAQAYGLAIQSTWNVAAELRRAGHRLKYRRVARQVATPVALVDTPA